MNIEKSTELLNINFSIYQAKNEVGIELVFQGSRF